MSMHTTHFRYDVDEMDMVSPTKTLILDMIIGASRMCAGEIADELGVPQGQVQPYLQKLVRSDFIYRSPRKDKSPISGKKVYFYQPAAFFITDHRD